MTFRPFIRLITRLATLLLFASCATLSGHYHDRGMASFYGKGFEGRKTASGELFNSHKLTAAHRSLPFGTRLRVRNLSNGSEVVVRVNDRGPFAKGRLIDLSEEAARELGFIQAGFTQVEIKQE